MGQVRGHGGAAVKHGGHLGEVYQEVGAKLLEEQGRAMGRRDKKQVAPSSRTRSVVNWRSHRIPAKGVQCPDWEREEGVFLQRSAIRAATVGSQVEGAGTSREKTRRTAEALAMTAGSAVETEAKAIEMEAPSRWRWSICCKTHVPHPAIPVRGSCLGRIG